MKIFLNIVITTKKYIKGVIKITTKKFEYNHQRSMNIIHHETVQE